jgi:gliding motility-associated-like protein
MIKRQIAILLFLLQLVQQNYAQLLVSNIQTESSSCKDTLSGKISFGVTGGISPYKYDWRVQYYDNYNRFRTDTSILSPAPKGKYNITITDNSSPPQKAYLEAEVLGNDSIAVFWHFECADHEVNKFPKVNIPVKLNLIIDSITNSLNGTSVIYSFNNDIETAWGHKKYQNNYQYRHKIDFYELDAPLKMKLISYWRDNPLYSTIHCYQRLYLPPPKTKELLKITTIPDTVILDGTNKVVNLSSTISTIFNNYQTSWERVEGTNITNQDFQKVGCSNCNNLSVSEDKECIYRFKVKSDECTEYAYIYFINPNKDKIETTAYLPTAFSPNDDGINDYFTAFSGGEVTKVLSMEVYDRWGGLLFQNSDFEPNVEAYGWNGKQRGTDAPQGNYTYTFRLLLKDGSEKEVKGEVLLIR